MTWLDDARAYIMERHAESTTLKFLIAYITAGKLSDNNDIFREVSLTASLSQSDMRVPAVTVRHGFRKIVTVKS